MTPPKSGQQHPRVLLIDDDPILRDVLAMMLDMDGYPIACVEDGQSALEQLDAYQPEVILMDTQMPGLSGVGLVQAIRRHSSARIVAISGSEVDAAISEATDGFLLKPFGTDELHALLMAEAKADSTVEEISLTAAGELADVPEVLPDVVIDPVVLGNFKAMMPAPSVREIYAAVATDLKGRIDSLSAAMNAGDRAEVARVAHAIKGGCAMVGLVGAKNAASHLETSDNPRGWPQELADLQSARISLEAMLSLDFPCNLG